MYAPTREEARRFLIEAWAKQRSGRPLAGVERIVAAVVALHPEYHALLEHASADLDRDFPPEGGAINPYLHLSLHIAVAEQLAVDQPPGIRIEFERLRIAWGNEHAALHAVLECLGEVVWQSQRLGAAPDSNLYLECLRKRRR